MPKPLIVWVVPVLVVLAGCGGTAAQINARNDMLGNPESEAVNPATGIPAGFFIPGTDQPLASWVQNQQNLGFPNWQSLPNMAPPSVYSYEGVP